MSDTHCPGCNSILVVQLEAGRGFSCLSCGMHVPGTGAATHPGTATLGSADTLAGHPGQADPRDSGSGLLGHYELVRFLGQGSVGNVFLMRQVVLDRLVAVKVPRAASLTAADVRRLRQEARALASIEHDNIVGVHDVRIEGNYPYLICEYVAGETLADRIARVRHLPAPEVASIATQILAGLAAAHAKGIIHRDLKPANIFLTEAGRAKIGDFGLAKSGLVPTETVPGGLVGTPVYMSPEQCQGMPATHASDLYSMGVILYEMCTGVYPFPGPTVIEFLTQHVSHVPPNLTTLRSDLPKALDAVVQRVLQKQPALRYATALEFSQALAEACQGEPNKSQALRRRSGTQPGTATPVAPRKARSSKPMAKEPSSSLFSTILLGIVPILVSLIIAGVLLKPRPAPRPRVEASPSIEPGVPAPQPIVTPRPRPTPRPTPRPARRPTPRPTGGSSPVPSASPKDALQEAEKQLRMATVTEPKNAWTHYRLALFLQSHKKIQEAILEYRQVLALTPQDGVAHWKLGCLYRDESRPSEALVELRQAVKFRPDDASYRVDLADVLWAERECGELEIFVRESLLKAPDNDQLHNYLGLVLDKLGQGKEAEVAYRRAVELAPDNSVFHFNLGILLQDMNRVEAIAALEKAVALDPQYSEARLALASVLEKKSKGQSVRPGWCARQATGRPDSPVGEDASSAWASQGEDDGAEWLELNYSHPFRANAVFVHQCFNPGAVVSVTLADEHRERMATIPVSVAKETVLAVRFETTPRPVKWVKVDLDTFKVGGWNEIDAVELVGPTGRAWADDAHASSFYLDEGDQTNKE